MEVEGASRDSHMNMAIITTQFEFPPLGFEYDRNNKHSRSMWANEAHFGIFVIFRRR